MKRIKGMQRVALTRASQAVIAEGFLGFEAFVAPVGYDNGADTLECLLSDLPEDPEDFRPYWLAGVAGQALFCKHLTVGCTPGLMVGAAKGGVFFTKQELEMLGDPEKLSEAEVELVVQYLHDNRDEVHKKAREGEARMDAPPELAN